MLNYIKMRYVICKVQLAKLQIENEKIALTKKQEL